MILLEPRNDAVGVKVVTALEIEYLVPLLESLRTNGTYLTFLDCVDLPCIQSCQELILDGVLGNFICELFVPNLLEGDAVHALYGRLKRVGVPIQDPIILIMPVYKVQIVLP